LQHFNHIFTGTLLMRKIIGIIGKWISYLVSASFGLLSVGLLVSFTLTGYKNNDLSGGFLLVAILIFLFIFLLAPIYELAHQTKPTNLDLVLSFFKKGNLKEYDIHDRIWGYSVIGSLLALPILLIIASLIQYFNIAKF